MVRSSSSGLVRNADRQMIAHTNDVGLTGPRDRQVEKVIAHSDAGIA
jgi:hypothetical protein